MKCPYCGNLGDKVVDSRESKEGEVIRRRRENGLITRAPGPKSDHSVRCLTLRRKSHLRFGYEATRLSDRGNQ